MGFSKRMMWKTKRYFASNIGGVGDYIFWKFRHFTSDNWKDGYLDNECIESSHRNELIRIIKHQFPKIECVVEVGSGSGENLFKLARLYNGIEATGLDINKRAITFARNRASHHNEKIYFYHLSISKFFNNKKQYDLVFSDAVLMYLEPKSFLDALKTFYHRSKEGVVLCEMFKEGQSIYNDKWIHSVDSIYEAFPQSMFLPLYDNSRGKEWSDFGKIMILKK